MDIRPVKKLLLPVGGERKGNERGNTGHAPAKRTTRDATTMTDPVQPEVSKEASEEESVELHPQLQELLQYLADDEHVTVIKTSTVESWHNRLTSLENTLATFAAKSETAMEATTVAIRQLGTLCLNQLHSVARDTPTTTVAPVSPLAAPVVVPVSPITPVTPIVAPVTPVVAPVTPVVAPVTPVTLVTPIVAPVTPIVAPVTPVVAPVTPVVAPVTPVTPVVAPVTPAVAPVTPVTPVTPVVAPVTPAVAPVTPVTPIIVPVTPVTPVVAPVTPVTPVVTPVTPVVTPVTPVDAPVAPVVAPVTPVTAPAVTGLSALLHKYAVEPPRGIQLYNKFVGHTYVLNYAGGAQRARDRLQKLGFTNCTTICPLSSKGDPLMNIHELLLYALRAAIGHGDQIAAFVVDIAHIHEQFAHYFEIVYPALTQTTDWTVMQMSDSTVHSATPGVHPTNCTHTIAFCLRRAVFEAVAAQIGTSGRVEGATLIPTSLSKICVCPSLFAVGPTRDVTIPQYERLCMV